MTSTHYQRPLGSSMGQLSRIENEKFQTLPVEFTDDLLPHQKPRHVTRYWLESFLEMVKESCTNTSWKISDQGTDATGVWNFVLSHPDAANKVTITSVSMAAVYHQSAGTGSVVGRVGVVRDIKRLMEEAF